MKKKSPSFKSQSGVGIDFIPVKSMHQKSWYKSPYHTDWYYHVPRKSGSGSDDFKRLGDTIDPCMSSLVEKFHMMNIPTMPSCQGHYHSDEEIIRKFISLTSDAEKIRSKGLKLQCVETGDCIVLMDSEWRLPWSMNEFVRLVSKTSETGYLGIKATLSGELTSKLSSYIDGLTIGNDDSGTTSFMMKTGDKDSQCQSWNKLERLISKTIKVQNPKD